MVKGRHGTGGLTWYSLVSFLFFNQVCFGGGGGGWMFGLFWSSPVQLLPSPWKEVVAKFLFKQLGRVCVEYKNQK